MECSKRYKNSFTPFRNLRFLTGFTLMEFLVILAIILILVGVSFPVLKQLQPNLQLSGAVRDLVTDLRYAQQLTITEQINYCVKLFLSEKKYQIIQCGETSPFSEVFLPEELVIFDATGFTANQVEFNPYGAVREPGTIVLENSQNKIKTIELKPSGFIRIID